MNDPQIRKALVKKIRKEYPSTSKIKNLIVHEMAICKGFARIDVALVNGKMHGYEIKSAEDTLSRLDRQIEYYRKCFDFITVIASQKHIGPLLTKYPNWLGIYLAEEKNQSLKIRKVRSASKNNDLKIFSLMQLLWKKELIKIAADECPSLKPLCISRNKIIEQLVHMSNQRVLEQKVRDMLKSRTTWPTAEFA